jgi:hypothetical protein
MMDVTIEAELANRLAQLRVIFRAVNVMTVETRDAATIHHALHEVVALYAVLVCGSVWVVEEIRWFAEPVAFQLPIIRQLQSPVIANRPIAILAFDWV